MITFMYTKPFSPVPSIWRLMMEKEEKNNNLICMNDVTKKPTWICWPTTLLCSRSLTVLAGCFVQQIQQNLVESFPLGFSSAQSWMVKRRGGWRRRQLEHLFHPLFGTFLKLLANLDLQPILFFFLLLVFILVVSSSSSSVRSPVLGWKKFRILHVHVISSSSILFFGWEVLASFAGRAVVLAAGCFFGPLTFPGWSAAALLIVVRNIMRLQEHQTVFTQF